MLPMIFVGCAYFLLQALVPGTNRKSELSEIWWLFIFPFTLYWYLPSLFLVFISVAVMDSLKTMNNLRNWLIVFVIALAIKLFRTYYISEEMENYFSYKGAMYLLPFFILGIGIQRFKDFFSNRYLLGAIGVALLLGLIIQQLSWFGVIDYHLRKGTGVGLMIGFTGAVMLMSIKWKVKWLIWIGSFAYTIYLFHAFGTAGARILVQKAGIHLDGIIFLVSLLTGVLLPILLEKILDPFPVTRMIFLGRSFNVKSKGD